MPSSSPRSTSFRSPRHTARELLAACRARAVIFDMDGVLADTEAFHVEAWQVLMDEKLGQRAPTELVRRTFGQTNDLIIPRLWAAVGATVSEPAELLSREKEALYRSVARGRVRPVPGVEALLAYLARRSDVDVAIGTSGPPENVEFVLEEFSWSQYFTAIVDRDRFAAGKPAPDCFLKAAEILRVAPNRALVFEDSVHGLLAARRGNFHACAVATTMPESQLWRYARWVVRDFRDLITAT